MKCTQCGTENEGGKFCTSCGAPLPADVDIVNAATETVDAAKENVESQMSDAADTAQEAVNTVQDTAQEAVNTAQDTVQEAVNTVQDTAQEAVNTAQDSVQTAAETVQTNMAGTVNTVSEQTGEYVNKTEEFIKSHPTQTAAAAGAMGGAAYANASGQPSEQKSKLVAGLLGIFLGAFGVHNFYLGYTNKAVIQVCVSGGCILLSCCTLGITLIGVLGIGIWGLVEGIMILTGNINVDGKGNPLKE